MGHIQIFSISNQYPYAANNKGKIISEMFTDLKVEGFDQFDDKRE
jgi:hypothetical protein